MEILVTHPQKQHESIYKFISLEEKPEPPQYYCPIVQGIGPNGAPLMGRAAIPAETDRAALAMAPAIARAAMSSLMAPRIVVPKGNSAGNVN